VAVLTHGEATLAFDDVGDGRPCFVFIHDWFCDRSEWSLQVGNLGANYRCVAVDLRGCGESSRAAAPNLDVLADDLAAVVGHLDIAPVIVAGHGLGGLLSLVFNHRHSGLTNGVVLVDAWLTLVASGEAGRLARAVRDAGSMEPAKPFVDSLFRGAGTAELISGYRDAMLGADASVAAGLLESAAALAPELSALLKEADAKPFMALWPSSPLGNPDELRNATLFLRQEPVPGSHFLHLEHPAVTAALLRAFVDDVERDPRLQRRD
jgi:pimeloyl-ACP methyl ester carboxylesterase